MFDTLKRQVRGAAVKRWANNSYTPNGAPPALFRLLRGRQSLSYMDVGAFSGQFFAALDEIASFDLVYLVEPLPEMAATLRKNFPKRTVLETAIGDLDGEITFHQCPKALYMSSILNLNEIASEHFSIAGGDVRSVRTDIAKLDTIAAKHSIERLDLLKIDTQGAELAILSGGASLLKRTSAVWLEVSFVKLYEGSCLFHEVHEALYALDFRMTELHPGWRTPSGELAQADALFQRL